MDPDQLASLENSVDPDQLASEEASWSGSTFVFNARCELVIINQNMKYRIVLTLYIVLVQGQVNRIFDLSWMNWDQVRQVGHGISTALISDCCDKIKKIVEAYVIMTTLLYIDI